MLVLKAVPLLKKAKSSQMITPLYPTIRTHFRLRTTYVTSRSILLTQERFLTTTRMFMTVVEPSKIRTISDTTLASEVDHQSPMMLQPVNLIRSTRMHSGSQASVPKSMSMNLRTKMKHLHQGGHHLRGASVPIVAQMITEARTEHTAVPILDATIDVVTVIAVEVATSLVVPG
jgi:hypothetical protein